MADFKMMFDAADLDTPLARVFVSNVVVDPAEVAAAFQVDFEYNEHWGGTITDGLVNGLGFFTGGVAEFKAAYGRCQAYHAVVYADGDKTLRQWLNSYRAKAHRFEPDASLPGMPVDGGDLIAFFDGFTVQQMLACGW